MTAVAARRWWYLLVSVGTGMAFTMGILYRQRAASHFLHEHHLWTAYSLGSFGMGCIGVIYLTTEVLSVWWGRHREGSK